MAAAPLAAGDPGAADGGGEGGVRQIAAVCLAIDAQAAEIYARLAERLPSGPASAFFLSMSKEERKHMEFWRRLADFAAACPVPCPFEDAGKVIKTLEGVLARSRALMASGNAPLDAGKAFLLACSLEYHMLHPAFDAIFQHTARIPGADLPSINYDSHVHRFLKGLRECQADSPELALIGEMLEALWIETKKLSRRSVTDDLTQILNRRGFLSTAIPLVHLARRTRAPFAVLMADIDHFKKINDTFGHAEGDNLLVRVAWLIRETLRRSDVVARHGGEEFAALLPGTGLDQAAEAAERVRRAVEEGTREEGRPATVSVGVAAGHFDGDAPVEAMIEAGLRAADACLYRAKVEGRNRVVAERPPIPAGGTDDRVEEIASERRDGGVTRGTHRRA